MPVIRPEFYKAIRSKFHGQWYIEVYDNKRQMMAVASQDGRPLSFDTKWQADAYGEVVLKLTKLQ